MGDGWEGDTALVHILAVIKNYRSEFDTPTFPEFSHGGPFHVVFQLDLIRRICFTFSYGFSLLVLKSPSLRNIDLRFFSK